MSENNDFFGQYISYGRQATDCPDTFHWFVSYCVASAVIGRNIHFPFGDNNIYPNLWLILLAPSSEYRKSTALGIGLGILRKVNPTLVLPSRFSEEKFLEDLAQNPCGLICFFEFKSLLDLIKKDYNAGLKSLLTELYDCPDIMSRKTKGGEFTIERPCLNIMAATTLEWFLNSCREDDFSGGFLARYLFVPVVQKGKDMPIPPPADQQQKQAIVIELLEIQKVRGIMSLSPSARKLHDEWYMKAKARCKIPQFRGIYSRLQIYLLKLAMIHSVVVNKSTVIKDASIKEASHLVDWLTKQFEELATDQFAFSKFEKQRNKVLHLIRSGKTSRRNLLQFSNLKAREFDDVIKTIIETGQITQRTGQKGGVVYELTNT